MRDRGRVWLALGCLIVLGVATACGGPADTAPGAPVPTAAATAAPTERAPSGTAVTVELVGAPTEAQAGSTFEVVVSVTGIEDLYGAELHLRFDPALLQVVDQRGNAAERVDDGELLVVRFTAQNVVDQAEGRIDYAVAQMPPSKGASGDGSLARIRFRALEPGVAAITLDDVLLASSKGEAIPWAAGVLGAEVEIY